MNLVYIMGIFCMAVFTYAVCLMEHRSVMKKVTQLHEAELASKQTTSYIEGYDDGLAARAKKMEADKWLSKQS